jgi:hypothetical protein
MGGKDLDQSDNAKIGDDGNGHQGGNAERATDLGIETGIIFGVFTGDEKTGANTLAGEPMGDVDGSPEGRRWFACPRTADHDVAGDAG